MIHDEEEAIARVMSEIGEGDLAVVLADSVPSVLAAIQKHAPPGAV